MSNTFDSQKTKLLKTKTVDFSINNKQFSSNYFKKVFSISPIQKSMTNQLSHFGLIVEFMNHFYSR